MDGVPVAGGGGIAQQIGTGRGAGGGQCGSDGTRPRPFVHGCRFDLVQSRCRADEKSRLAFHQSVAVPVGLEGEGDEGDVSPDANAVAPAGHCEVGFDLEGAMPNKGLIAVHHSSG